MKDTEKWETAPDAIKGKVIWILQRYCETSRVEK